MAQTQDYLSPDGILRFLVITGDDGDVSLGFSGYSWHTHAEILAVTKGLTELEAVEQFVCDLTESRTVIVISRIRGQIRDVWVTDDPQGELRYIADEESLEFRFWDGSAPSLA
jgi:hypothetical protein